MPNTALNRSGVFLATNKSGGAVAQGDTVVLGSATANAFTTTTTSAFVDSVVAVVMEPNGIANNAMGLIAVGMWVPHLNLSSAASLYDFIHTHTVAGQSARHAAPAVAGDFAIALETGTSPAAIVFGFPCQGTGGGGGGATIGSDVLVNLPIPGTSGNAYLPTDGLSLFRSTGAIEFAWGPLYPFLDPVDDSAFSWLNQAGASVTVDNDGVYLEMPIESPATFHCRTIPVPTPPYVLTMAFVPNPQRWQFFFGIGLMDSVSKKMHGVRIGDYQNDVLQVPDVTANGASSLDPIANGVATTSAMVYCQIEDDNVDRHYRMSYDGKHFIEMFSEANNAYLTPNSIGFFVGSWSNVTDFTVGGVTLAGMRQT